MWGPGNESFTFLANMTTFLGRVNKTVHGKKLWKNQASYNEITVIFITGKHKPEAQAIKME